MKKDARWRLASDHQLQLDQAEIDAYIESLSRIEITEFIDQPSIQLKETLRLNTLNKEKDPFVLFQAKDTQKGYFLIENGENILLNPMSKSSLLKLSTGSKELLISLYGTFSFEDCTHSRY